MRLLLHRLKAVFCPEPCGLGVGLLICQPHPGKACGLQFFQQFFHQAGAYTLTGEAAVYHKQADISRFRRRIPVDQVQHRRQTVPMEIAQEILVLRCCSRRQQRHILPDVRLAGLCAAVPVVQRVAAAQGQDLRRVLLCQPSHPIRPGQSLYVQHGHSPRI